MSVPRCTGFRVWAAVRLAFIGLCFAMASDFAMADSFTLSADGTYVEDNTTGLDWMTLSQTSNLTINQVLAGIDPGGQFSGWQIATYSQVSGLLAGYNVPSSANDATSYAETLSAINILGSNLSGDGSSAQFASFLDNGSYEHTALEAEFLGNAYTSSVQIFDGLVNEVGYVLDNPITTWFCYTDTVDVVCSEAAATESSGHSGTGPCYTARCGYGGYSVTTYQQDFYDPTYLVREDASSVPSTSPSSVPEPASSTILAFGVLGLGLVRARRRFSGRL